MLFFLLGACFCCSILPLLDDMRVHLSATRAFPASTFRRKPLACLWGAVHTADLALGICVHEAPYSDERSPDSPCWLPRLLMMTAYTKTYLPVDFKPTRRRQEPEGRWS